MAQELYHKYIKPKTTKQYPSKKNSLKMPYHLGSALLLAFNMWQKSNEPNPYQNSVIEQFKTELFKQLL